MKPYHKRPVNYYFKVMNMYYVKKLNRWFNFGGIPKGLGSSHQVFKTKKKLIKYLEEVFFKDYPEINFGRLELNKIWLSGKIYVGSCKKVRYLKIKKKVKKNERQGFEIQVYKLQG